MNVSDKGSALRKAVTSLFDFIDGWLTEEQHDGSHDIDEFDDDCLVCQMEAEKAKVTKAVSDISGLLEAQEKAEPVLIVTRRCDGQAALKWLSVPDCAISGRIELYLHPEPPTTPVVGEKELRTAFECSWLDIDTGICLDRDELTDQYFTGGLDDAWLAWKSCAEFFQAHAKLGQTTDKACSAVVPDEFDLIYKQVKEELSRALTKFPSWPDDPIHAFAVLGEEVGELQKDVLQMVYEPHKTSLDNVKKEAVQAAAMALRFLHSIDRYWYAPSAQHKQAMFKGGRDDTRRTN